MLSSSQVHRNIGSKLSCIHLVGPIARFLKPVICFTQQARSKSDVSCQVSTPDANAKARSNSHSLLRKQSRTRRPYNPLSHASHMLLT